MDVLAQVTNNYTCENYTTSGQMIDGWTVDRLSKIITIPKNIGVKNSINPPTPAEIFLKLKRAIPYYNKDKREIQFKEGLIPQLTPVNVIFNPPATIVFWEDGKKTVVKCGKDEIFDKEKGLAMAFCKRVWGNVGKFNDMFAKWCFDEETK